MEAHKNKTPQAIANKIIHWRNRGWSADRVAAKVGVDRKTVYRISGEGQKNVEVHGAEFKTPKLETFRVTLADTLKNEISNRLNTCKTFGEIRNTLAEFAAELS